MSFGQRLRKLREQKTITQKELSKILNVSESTIGMYERGEREPNFETVQKIADFFEASIDYLLGRTNDPDTYIASSRLGGRGGLRANATVDRGVVEESAAEYNGKTIVTRESDRNYTVVARSKNLPPEKIEKLEKLLDLLFDEDDEEQNDKKS